MSVINTFTDDAVRRIFNMLRAYEHPAPKARQPDRPRRTPGLSVKYALTTTAVGKATSQTSPGTGTATLQRLSSGTISALTPTQSVTVYSDHDKGIPTGTMILVAFVDEEWVVIDVYTCSTLTS